MKIIALLALLCLSFLALAQMPHAAAGFSGLGNAMCNALFAHEASSTGIGALANADYTGVLQIAFLIVVAVFALLGITYGLGTSLGIETLKRFSTSEALESLFNLVLIVLLVPGLAVVNGISGFIANLGLAAVNVASPQTAAVSSFSAETLMPQLCTSYMTFGVETTINGVFGLLPDLYIYQTLFSLDVQFMPNGFGFTDTPFHGDYPWTQVLNLEIEAYLAIGGIMSSVSMFLFVIYFIFPVFLYAGILLRSFAWTRAAGGSLLAVFISFYIIFPALLYPFSTQLAQPALYFTPQSGSQGTSVSLSGDGYAVSSSGLKACFSTSSSDTSKCVGSPQAVSIDGSGSMEPGTSLKVPVPSPKVPAGQSFVPYYILVYSGSVVVTYVQVNLQSGGTFTSSTNCQGISASNIQSSSQYGCLIGSNGAVSQMTHFVSTISYPILQVFGVAISFIIAFDLLERFGDLLGAPSLSSGKIMHKVI